MKAELDRNMIAEPEVSVLINNYNYGAFLPRAIDTALGQDGVRAEVIVVDDGSTDDSADIIRGYGDRIRPIFQQNGGQASAINAGVAAARAPVLTFLDADDWWAPDKLALVLKAMPVGIVYAIWSGLGIVLISAIGWWVYGQQLDLPAILGLGCILLGVAIINLFSNASGH